MSDALQTRREQQPEQRNQMTVMLGHEEAWSGPLPPPEILARFDQAVPGAANRIIAMAESQQAHRIEVERSVAVQETQIKREGLKFAYHISLGGLIVAGVAAVFTKDPRIVGAIMAGGLIPLVAKFLPRGKKKED